jgi:hypothetical protein
MSTRNAIRIVFASAVLGLLLTGSTSASPDARTTHFQFTRAVGLPSVVLPPGSYTFELATSDRLDLVRVMSRDRSKVYLTALTIPIERPAATTLNAAIVLGESSRNAVPPIRIWFPSGERRGFQFVY